MCANAHDATESRRVRALLLGGSSEARRLATRLAAEPRLDALLSLAGRTQAPAEQPLPTRIGGFGGVEGLARFLTESRIDKVIDATHPFAAQMSRNARLACAAAGVPLAVFSRPPWTPVASDLWTIVGDNVAAAAALGAQPRRVFLTIGRLGLGAFRAAPHHDYLLRTIDPPAPEDIPPRCDILYARGPFARDDEMALMRDCGIDCLVTKNSGGDATYAKIEAARALALEVVVVQPPAQGDARRVADVEAAMNFLLEGA
jgi:precorrin-6A/cobalt-precorrin-6A reductase